MIKPWEERQQEAAAAYRAWQEGGSKGDFSTMPRLLGKEEAMLEEILERLRNSKTGE